MVCNELNEDEGNVEREMKRKEERNDMRRVEKGCFQSNRNPGSCFLSV